MRRIVKSQSYPNLLRKEHHMNSKNENGLLAGLKQNQKYTLLAMVSLAVCLVICLILLVIASINFTGDDSDNSLPTTDLNSYTVEGATSLNAKESDYLGGTLTVVNKNHKFELPASSLKLVTLYEYRCAQLGCTSEQGHRDHAYKTSGYEKDGDIMLTEETAKNLHNMLVDLNSSTHSISYVAIGYRSLAGQENNVPAPSGFSDFHTGLLVNLKAYVGDTNTALELTAQENEAVYNWILSNAHKYGFIQRYPTGKEDATGVTNYLNAFRYVGVAHATYMKENNLCLEEYIAKLKETKPTIDNPLKIQIKNGSSTEIYAVYYYDFTEGEIKVPASDYTISGTNMGGIVVTAKLK